MVPSSSLLECLAPGRGSAAIEEDGEDQGTAISAGRTTVRRAISGPLTPVTSGLSRSLADTPRRRSGHATGPDGTASQAVPEGPDNESLRLELQEALVTYRHWVTQLTQVTGFAVAADVVLISYAFSQRLAGILLLASAVPILILVMDVVVGSIACRLVDLVLRNRKKIAYTGRFP